MTTDPTSRDAHHTPLQRDENDDDLDLLTYNEARARLSEELLAEERRLAALRQSLTSGAQPDPDEQAMQALERRVQALREALARSTSPAITPANAASFYGTPTEPPQA